MFEQEALFPHRDVEHLYRKKQQPPGSLRPLVAFVESQEGTLHLDSLGWGADSLLCTFTLKIDTCPIFDGLNLCYLQSRECRISTFQLSAWAEQAMESAQPLPLNPKIKAFMVICKLGGGG